MDNHQFIYPILVSIVTATLGLVSFTLCIAAEFKKTKKKDLRFDGKLCYLPGSVAFELGIAALICLVIAQVIGNLFICRNFFSRNQPNNSKSKKKPSLNGFICGLSCLQVARDGYINARMRGRKALVSKSEDSGDRGWMHRYVYVQSRLLTRGDKTNLREAWNKTPDKILYDGLITEEELSAWVEPILTEFTHEQRQWPHYASLKHLSNPSTHGLGTGGSYFPAPPPEEVVVDPVAEVNEEAAAILQTAAAIKAREGGEEVLASLKRKQTNSEKSKPKKKKRTARKTPQSSEKTVEATVGATETPKSGQESIKSSAAAPESAEPVVVVLSDSEVPDEGLNQRRRAYLRSDKRRAAETSSYAFEQSPRVGDGEEEKAEEMGEERIQGSFAFFPEASEPSEPERARSQQSEPEQVSNRRSGKEPMAEDVEEKGEKEGEEKGETGEEVDGWKKAGGEAEPQVFYYKDMINLAADGVAPVYLQECDTLGLGESGDVEISRTRLTRRVSLGGTIGAYSVKGIRHKFGPDYPSEQAREPRPCMRECDFIIPPDTDFLTKPGHLVKVTSNLIGPREEWNMRSMNDEQLAYAIAEDTARASMMATELMLRSRLNNQDQVLGLKKDLLEVLQANHALEEEKKVLIGEKRVLEGRCDFFEDKIERLEKSNAEASDKISALLEEKDRLLDEKDRFVLSFEDLKAKMDEQGRQISQLAHELNMKEITLASIRDASDLMLRNMNKAEAESQAARGELQEARHRVAESAKVQELLTKDLANLRDRYTIESKLEALEAKKKLLIQMQRGQINVDLVLDQTIAAIISVKQVLGMEVGADDDGVEGDDEGSEDNEDEEDEDLGGDPTDGASASGRDPGQHDD